MSAGGDSKGWMNISTNQQLVLLGGVYAITVTASFGGGSVALQRYSGDGSTLVSVLPPFTSNGYGAISLPPGQYQLTITTATAVYAEVVKVIQS